MKNSLMPLATLLILTLAATLFLSVNATQEADAHCQVPCGVYDDGARIAQLTEDALTIKKACDFVNAFTEGEVTAVGINQVGRWVQTKEDHASHIISVVSEYFLTQKVKTKAKGTAQYAAYLDSLAKHHAVMVAAMKTKQQVSSDAVHNLEHAIADLGKLYQ
jgi:nickel superoxide dismutase